MQKIFFLVFFSSFVFKLYAQDTLQKPKEMCNVIVDVKEGLYYFYIKNTYLVPFQVQLVPKIKYKIKQLGENTDSTLYGIVPAKQEKYLFMVIEPQNLPKNKGFSYSITTNMGNPNSIIDTNFVYMLPYEVGTKHFVMQGYNGRFSHRKQFALDFKMKVGTPIHAARGGIVIELKEDSDKRGRKPEFAQYANFVNILHNDGSIAIYFHLQKDGALVNVGDTVKIGQKIALSGNTGWSTGPHLHFAVKKPTKNGALVTIPTLFAGKKNKKIRLKGWKSYRSYPKPEN
jgi:murein DD-endopeptidase MepM/ murein hydrolase activator NlpD